METDSGPTSQSSHSVNRAAVEGGRMDGLSVFRAGGRSGTVASTVRGDLVVAVALSCVWSFGEVQDCGNHDVPFIVHRDTIDVNPSPTSIRP